MSDKLTIRTNNVPRDVLHWRDLTAKEQKEFDYLETEDPQAEATFVRYKHVTYHLEDFVAIRGAQSAGSTPQMKAAGFDAWDGYAGDSYFSGVLFRYTRDFERVVMGTYYS